MITLAAESTAIDPGSVTTFVVLAIIAILLTGAGKGGKK